MLRVRDRWRCIKNGPSGHKWQLTGAGVSGFGYCAGEVDDDGNFSIGSIRIPELFSHSPVMEIAKVGAKARKSKHSVKETAKALAEAIISNAPGSEILAPVSRALSRSQPGNPAADIGEAVGGGLVPPKVAAEARKIVEEMLSQQKPNPRKSKGSAIKAGAPVSPAVVAEAKRIIDEMVRIQKAKSKKHNRR